MSFHAIDVERPVFLTAGALLICLPVWGTWVQIGPFGGSASIIVSNPHYPGTFVAGTRNALLFRSSDRGESWNPLPFPPQFQAVLNTLVMDPELNGVYLAGLSSDLAQYSGIMRSGDGGTTWHQVPDLRGQRVRALAYKRANSRLVAAGTDSGVFLSEDHGVTWRRISPSDDSRLQPIVAIAFDPNRSTTLYAGTPHLPWMTSDSGDSWQSIHNGMMDDSDVFSIQPDRNHPRRILAAACSGIYRSLNGGDTWTKLMETKGASYRTYVVVQDPEYENTWFAGTAHGLLRSDDSGTTWVKLGSFITRSIAFDPSRLGRVFIATEGEGILRSEDSGRTFQPVNQGFSNVRVSSAWIEGGEFYITVGDPTAGGVFRLTGPPDSWERIDVLPANPVTIPGAPPSAPLAVSSTLDHVVRYKLPDPASRTFVYSVVSTRGDVLLAATSSGLRASNDQGNSWHTVPGEMQSDTIQAICRHPQKEGELFAAKYGAIYTSVDAGHTWRRISPEQWPISSVKQLTIIPGATDRLMVLTQQQGIWEFPLDQRGL